MRMLAEPPAMRSVGSISPIRDEPSMKWSGAARAAATLAGPPQSTPPGVNASPQVTAEDQRKTCGDCGWAKCCAVVKLIAARGYRTSCLFYKS
jgi:hypothetical protein